MDDTVVKKAKEDAMLRSKLQTILITGATKANQLQIETTNLSLKKQKEASSPIGKSAELSYRKIPAENAFNAESPSEKLPRISVGTSNSNLDISGSPTPLNKQIQKLKVIVHSSTPQKPNGNSLAKDVLTEYGYFRSDNMQEEAPQLNRRTLSPRGKAISSIPDDIDEVAEFQKEKFEHYFRFSETKHQSKLLTPRTKETTPKSISISGNLSQSKELNNNNSMNEIPFSLIFNPDSTVEKRKRMIKKLKFGAEKAKSIELDGVSPKSEAQQFRALCKMLKIDKVLKKETRSFAKLTGEEENPYGSSSIGQKSLSLSDIKRKSSISKIEVSQTKDKNSMNLGNERTLHRGLTLIPKGNYVIPSPRSENRLNVNLPPIFEVKGKSAHHI